MIKSFVKLIPGLLGAIAAYGAIRLFGWTSNSVQIAVFFGVYIVVTLLIDTAMTRYGKSE